MENRPSSAMSVFSFEEQCAKVAHRKAITPHAHIHTGTCPQREKTYIHNTKRQMQIAHTLWPRLASGAAAKC